MLFNKKKVDEIGQTEEEQGSADKGFYNIEEVNKIKSIVRKKSIFYTSIVFIFISFFILLLLIMKTPLYKLGLSPELIKLVTVYEYYQNEYINPIDVENMVDNAIIGMVKASDDKYGGYLSAKKSRVQASILQTGNYFGLGITYIIHSNKYLEIINVEEGTPAEEAGMKVGDIIVKIDGRDISENVIEEFRVSLEDKSQVEFTLRSGKVITVFPKEIQRPKVDYYIDDNVGYLIVHTFVPDTYDLFKGAFKNLVDADVKEIVIDLRDNGGGDVDAAIKTLDCIVGEEFIAKLDYKFEKIADEEFIGDKETLYNTDIPISIIGGPNTASASELFILCLQDTYDVKLYGQKTYGKNTILKASQFNDGSLFIVSTGKCLTKSERDIEGIGILPDVYIPISFMEFKPEVLYDMYIKGN